MRDISIIGAGMAGSAAAFYLKEAGYDPIVWEARNRTDGRTFTDYPEILGIPLEKGAEFMHYPVSRLGRFIHAMNMPTVPWRKTNDMLFHPDGGELMYMDQACREDRELAIVRSWGWTEKEVLKVKILEGDESAANFLRRAGLSERQIKLYERGYGNACGESMDLLSAKQFMHDSTAYSGDDLKMLGGYGRVIKKLLHRVDVRLNHDVHTVDWSDKNKVRITFADGKMHESDAVVITVPLKMLQAGHIRFNPGLPPSKIMALSKMRMAPMLKMTFAFKEPVLKHKALAVSCNGAPPTWWSPNAGREEFPDIPQSPFDVWTGFSGGNFSRKLLTMKPDEALAYGLKVFQETTGDKQIPIMKDFVNWVTDPYAGGYSVDMIGAGNAREILARQTGLLIWAGEHTASTSTAHGAFDSGWRASRQIQKLHL